MERLFLIIFLLFHTLQITGQNQDYNYEGLLILDENTMIPYNIYFTKSNDSIIGYSISDINGLDETKSSITGYFNNNELTINENDIMYTKSTTDYKDFCFLRLTVKQESSGNFELLSGNFDGYYLDSSICASGKVSLIDSIPFKSPGDKLIPDNKKELKPFTVKTITEKNYLSFITKKDSIQFNIWDSGKIDNDIISIYHNDNLVIANYSLVKDKLILDVGLAKGNNIFKIKAIDDGIYSPNTSRIEILGGKKSYNVVTSIDKGAETKIIVKKR